MCLMKNVEVLTLHKRESMIELRGKYKDMINDPLLQILWEDIIGFIVLIPCP